MPELLVPMETLRLLSRLSDQGYPKGRLLVTQNMIKNQMTSDRRGFMKAAVAMAAAAAIGAAALAPGASAQDGPEDLGALLGGLPPVGTDIPATVSAANVPLKLNALGALTPDFKGGINFSVKTSKADGLVVEVQGFRVEADTSPNTPKAGTLIAMSMADATLTPLSIIRSDGEMLVYLSLTVEVIDKATGETTTMLSTDPAKYATLKATKLKEFPPVNQLYTLQEPVQLYEQQGGTLTDKPAGTLGGFDAIVNKSE